MGYRKSILITLCFMASSCATGNNNADDQYFTDSKKYLLNLWDTNSDGTITCDDVERRKLYRFAYADRNNDGNLSFAEFSPAPWTGGQNADNNFQKFDKNDDGIVSRDEFMLNAGSDFTLLDNNNNCIVTDQEIRVYMGIN
jgi:Ca2+-binding EF-hand superfamily protein